MNFPVCLQGKGLYARTHFKEGDEILTETPLVCAQFSWNEVYKYAACEFCLRSLEMAEEMSRRLSDNPALDLPHPECCEVNPSLYTCCPHCQVNVGVLLFNPLCHTTIVATAQHPPSGSNYSIF